MSMRVAPPSPTDFNSGNRVLAVHGNLFSTTHARMGASLLQREMVFGNPVLDLVIKLGGPLGSVGPVCAVRMLCCSGRRQKQTLS